MLQYSTILGRYVTEIYSFRIDRIGSIFFIFTDPKDIIVFSILILVLLKSIITTQINSNCMYYLHREKN